MYMRMFVLNIVPVTKRLLTAASG